MSSQGPGEQHGTAKLSEAQVRAIRRRHARGERQQTLVELFGISKAQVSKIVNGHAWVHLEKELDGER